MNHLIRGSGLRTVTKHNHDLWDDPRSTDYGEWPSQGSLDVIDNWGSCVPKKSVFFFGTNDDQPVDGIGYLLFLILWTLYNIFIIYIYLSTYIVHYIISYHIISHTLYIVLFPSQVNESSGARGSGSSARRMLRTDSLLLG